MPRSRRGRGEGALFFCESKDCWIARAIVGTHPDGSPKYKEVSSKSQAGALAKKKRVFTRIRG